MKRKWKILLVVLVVFVVVSIGAAIFIRAYEEGFMSSGRRVQNEHGITLPDSARDFLCTGNAWRGFLDRGATAIFQIDRTDLNTFLSQLSAHDDADVGFVQYGYDDEPPSAWGDPKGIFRCSHSTGDWTVMAVYDLSPSTVGIRIYTDWN